MATSVALRQERARVVEQMRALTDRAEAENRGLSAEERGQFEGWEGEFNGLTERIARQETLEQREAEAARSLEGSADAQRAAGTPDEREARSRAQRDAFMGFVRHGRDGITPEQRALVLNAAGEILVPEDLEAEIIRALPGLTAIRGIASQRTTQSNRIRRRSLGEVAVGWGRLETGGQTLTDSMPGTPTEEWTYIEDLYGLAKVGEDEFDDADYNLEAHIRDSFSRALAEAEEAAFVAGTGHANKMPVGILDTLGGVSTRTGTFAVAASTNAERQKVLDDLIALAFDVDPRYARNGRYVWNRTLSALASVTKDGNGRYLWQASTQVGQPSTFNGYAVTEVGDVPSIGAANAKIAAFGDFNAGYRVYDRLGMTVQRLVEIYAEEGMVGFKVRKRVGGDVIRPEALKVLRAAAA